MTGKSGRFKTTVDEMMDTMDGRRYQGLAMRTNDGCETYRVTEKIKNNCGSGIDIGEILNSCLGMSGEVGEVNDMIKKWIFHEADLDEEHLQLELGDILWYVALLCDAFGWDMKKIMVMNILKLQKRYPDGFDTDRANNRKEGDV